MTAAFIKILVTITLMAMMGAIGLEVKSCRAGRGSPELAADHEGRAGKLPGVSPR